MCVPIITRKGTHRMPYVASIDWYVYIILCTDNTLYTGITINIPRRFNQHAAGRGAKYFRGRQPKHLVYIEPGHNLSSATKREIELKKLSRAEKSGIISSDMNKITELLFQNFFSFG